MMSLGKLSWKSCTLVEMDRNRENSRCCGAGSGVKSAYPDTSLLVAQRRIGDAEDTEAELLVTACSFCILNLQNALELRIEELNRRYC